MNDELATDLIRVLLFDLADRVPFGDSSFRTSPYSLELTKLAAKYRVPSITDTGEILRQPPQVPEGKIRNG